jgi:hypothetical protein
MSSRAGDPEPVKRLFPVGTMSHLQTRLVPRCTAGARCRTPWTTRRPDFETGLSARLSRWRRTRQTSRVGPWAGALARTCGRSTGNFVVRRSRDEHLSVGRTASGGWCIDTPIQSRRPTLRGRCGGAEVVPVSRRLGHQGGAVAPGERLRFAMPDARNGGTGVSLRAISDSRRRRVVGTRRAWPQVGCGCGREVDVPKGDSCTRPRPIALCNAGTRRSMTSRQGGSRRIAACREEKLHSAAEFHSSARPEPRLRRSARGRSGLSTPPTRA